MRSVRTTFVAGHIVPIARHIWRPGLVMADRLDSFAIISRDEGRIGEQMAAPVGGYRGEGGLAASAPDSSRCFCP